VLLVVASSCSAEKFYTPPDHAQWYDGSRTTSLHHQGDGKTSFLSDLRTTASDSRDIRGLRDLYDLPNQLC
jgi:hypothetical protein